VSSARVREGVIVASATLSSLQRRKPTKAEDSMVADAATVRFTAQPAESLRASRFINRRLRLLMQLPPVILFITGLAITPFLGWPEAIPYVLTLWAIGLLLVGFDLVLPILSQRRIAQRYPQLFDTETVVTVDDAGLQLTRSATSVVRGWAGITDYIENCEFIVIRDGHLAVAVIPKRSFPDAHDRQAFVAVLHRHLPAPQARLP
jgi:hypothetical protein